MSSIWNASAPQQPAAQMHKNAGGGARKFGVDLTSNQNHGNTLGAAKGKVAPKTSSTSASSSSSSSSASSMTSSSASAVPQQQQRSCTFENRIENIDAIDRGNPQCVADYAHEIHQHFRQVEHTRMAPTNYMELQKHINVKMRSILIDWLVEVHLKFKLMPETLYLTINLIDRYLSRQPCARRKLQLVGVTCMLLASKYEEIYFPEVRDFVYITDKAYSREEILSMEGVILNALKFDLTVATPLVFLKRCLKAAKANTHVANLAHFFTERMLQEYTMLRFTPSKIAASAVSMALRVAGHASWSPTMAHYANYQERDLSECVSTMSRIIMAKNNLQSVSKKYSSRRFGRVSQTQFAPTLFASTMESF